MSLRDDIIAIIDRHARKPKQATTIEGLSIFRVAAPTLPAESVYTPRLCVVFQGEKKISLGRQAFEVCDTQYFVATVNLPVSASIIAASTRHPHYALSLEFSRHDMVDVLQGLACGPEQADRVGLAVGKYSDDILQASHRLLALLDRPEDQSILLGPAKTELYYRLLQGEHGPVLRDYATSGSKIAQIGKVTLWIKEHYNEPMTIASLSRLAGMSPTSLHRHFKAMTLMSPLEYRTRVRLQEARKRLLLDHSSARRVGFDVGYESQTQFTREYKRVFGRPPADDAARLKGLRPA